MDAVLFCEASRVQNYRSVPDQVACFKAQTLAVRYFPHEVSDLCVVKQYILSNSQIQKTESWHLKYLLLLWLSLICMLPFDLARFDEHEPGETARSLEAIGKIDLEKSGLTREGSSLMLSRLYMRQVDEEA